MAWGAAPPGEPHRERPQAFDLQHQVVRVAFDWPRRAVLGSTELRLAALDRPLPAVQLDAVGMSIKRVTDGSGTALAYRYDGRTLSIDLPAPLVPHAVATIAVDYEAIRPKAGVYFVERRHVVWTQGTPEDNRYWMPTYDYPNDKATWEFFVRTAADERGFASGRLAERRPVTGGIEWHWVHDRPAPAYLMGVAAGGYATVEDTTRAAGAITLRYWAYPDSLEAARQGFAATPAAIRIFSQKLGLRFPSGSFDQAVVPDYVFWEWLESWRPVVTTPLLDDRMVLGDADGWPGEERELGIARAVAQEWFGKLLTPRDWSHAWLSEGFAHFMAHVYLEEVRGADAARHVREWAHVGAFAADRDARRPLVYDRWRYGPIELWLTEHLQHRGASVLQMLRRELGDALFWRGMGHYARKHAGGLVTTDDFRRAMEEATARDLRRFFEQWVYGAGFPFLRIAFRHDPAARRVTLVARQVQRRDALTRFFEASVDVEVLTDRGPVRAVMPLKAQAVTEFTFEVPSEPRAVRWDTGRWLISEVEFPRPTPMLVHQLKHAADEWGRVEALRELMERARGLEGTGGVQIVVEQLGDSTAGLPTGDSAAAAAIVDAARSDPSPHVRHEAISSMMGAFDPLSRSALLQFSRDPDPAVRANAAVALFAVPVPEVTQRLREMATSDPALKVRELAAQSLSMVEPQLQLALAREVLASRSATDLERANAVSHAAGSRLPGGWELGKRYLTDPKSSRAVRQAAMRALGVAVFMSRFTPRANARELVELLKPFLDSDDPSLRLSAARELHHAKIPESLAALNERKRVEVDARVLAEIDASLREIEQGDRMTR